MNEKNVTKEIEKEDLNKKKNDKKCKDYHSLAVLLFFLGVPSIYSIGAILSRIFGTSDITFIFLIFGIIVMVGSLIYIFSVKEKKKIPQNIYETILAIIIILSIIGAIFLIVDLGTEPIETSDNRPRKYINCENKSDTYSKCSWSYSENRCVCKRR